MTNCVRRATPLALAFLVALVGSAFAGVNENATFSVTEVRSGPTPNELTVGSLTSVSGLEGTGLIEIDLLGENWVDVKQVDVFVDVSSSDDFNLVAVQLGPEMPQSDAFPPGAWNVPGVGQLLSDNRYRVGWALLAEGLDDALTGSATFTLRVGFDLAAGTEGTITVDVISIGPGSEDRDEISVGATVTVNPAAPPVIEPTLTAVGATDASLDFSASGTGDAADGSAGEVTFTVAFTDNTGGAGEGQSITWSITNNGSEPVFLVNGGSTEIAANTTSEETSSTDADGQASATFDSEGDKSAGSTSISVTASTTADNSEGDSSDLSVGFSATWDVPVPAELSSFSGEVTGDQEVLLVWGVASQSNNLGWEVFRSLDAIVYERVGELVAGEGTTDIYRTYQFMDETPPVADVVHYYLKQVDLDGNAARSNTVAVALAPAVLMPTAYALSQNFPNPFNPATTITFDLAAESMVALVIYDAAGQVVRRLVDGQTIAAGHYSADWDGIDEDGGSVGSGVYFYELRAGTFSSMKKMTLLH